MKTEKAMTLAETLVVFIIIGIIAALAVITIKPYEKTYKWLYSKMYHTIETAIYNSMLTRGEFPADSKEFCKALLEYINTEEHTNDDNEALCAISKNVGLNERNFPDNKVQFTASNAARFYIGSNGGQPFEHSEIDTNGNEVLVKYYMVFTDINGPRKPNSAEWSNKKMSDIVGFVVTENSAVVPVGYPEIDTRYIPAVVVYPDMDDDENEKTSLPMTYFNAKHRAWGNHVDANEPMSLTFQNDFAENSHFRIHYPATPSVDTENGCIDGDSPCFVRIEEYN